MYRIIAFTILWVSLFSIFAAFLTNPRHFPVIAAASFSGVGAIIGLGVGIILVRELSPRHRMWGLRLLGAVSLLPLFRNMQYARSQAIAELSVNSGVGEFVAVSFVIMLAAIAAGWALSAVFPPLIAIIPPTAFVAYFHLALRDVLSREGFWPDNVSLIWLFIYEAGATVFLFAAGWIVWRARSASGLSYPSARRE